MLNRINKTKDYISVCKLIYIYIIKRESHTSLVKDGEFKAFSSTLTVMSSDSLLCKTTSPCRSLVQGSSQTLRVKYKVK